MDLQPQTPTRSSRHQAAEMLPLDTGHLSRFTMGDRALEREVLGLFTGELPRRIAALRAACTEKEWIMAAHTLKGSGRAVGAWRVALSAQHAENIGGVADRDACERAVRSIEEAAEEVVSHIRELYDPLTA